MPQNSPHGSRVVRYQVIYVYLKAEGGGQGEGWMKWMEAVRMSVRMRGRVNVREGGENPLSSHLYQYANYEKRIVCVFPMRRVGQDEG